MLCPVCSTENVEGAAQCSSCSSSLGFGRDDATFSPVDSPTFGSASVKVSGRAAAGVAPAVKADEPPPDFGSRYRIDSKLGQGGMGAVFKAYDRELDRYVALKIIRGELMSNSEILQRFKQELLLASRISHKHVLRIHDLGDAAGVKFISMAYIEGEDLANRIQREKMLPLETALTYAKQLCQALAAAHREGVVHRDLKPQNILIDRNDSVYVSDFGLAKSLESDSLAATAMTSAGQVLGTPRYMSPEQVEAGPIDGRTDIYSFGLILYEMVTGDVPFQGNSLQLMLGRVQSIPRNPSLLNSKLPPYLAGIIMRCLEKDVERRYQTFSDVLADLEAQHCTPAGKKSKAAGISLHLSRGYAVAIVAVLVVAAGLVVARRYLPARWGGAASGSGTAPVAIERVAVLPFQIAGNDEQLNEIGLGIDESLYAKFFGLKNVQIAPLAAAQKLPANVPLQKASRDLGANLIISGSLQGAGDRIQIIVNLDDAATGRHLLTKEFPGMRQDLLSLEDQIYSKLIQTMEGKPSGESLARVSLHQTENYSAYELYLKGRNAMRGQLDPKNVEKALGLYDQAVKLDPGFAMAYAGISDADLRMYRSTKQGDWASQALSAAQQSQSLNPELPEAYFALGSAYIATGRNAEAIAVLKRALELAPNSDDGYRRLGDAFRASGNKDEALKAYQRAVDLNPYYWFNYNALGSADLKFSDYQKALAAFEHVTQLEPDNASGYQNLSVAYFSLGELEKCIPVLQKALELDKKPAAYSNLGTVYFYLKRYADAVPMFERAVQLDPASEANLGNLADAYRWAGRTKDANQTYAKAIEAGYKGLAVNSRDAALMGRMALYYAKESNQAQANNLIRRARAIDPNDASLAYDDAIILQIAGHQQDAIGELRLAVNKGYPVDALQTDPEVAKLNSDPQFAQILKSGKQ